MCECEPGVHAVESGGEIRPHCPCVRRRRVQNRDIRGRGFRCQQPIFDSSNLPRDFCIRVPEFRQAPPQMAARRRTTFVTAPARTVGKILPHPHAASGLADGLCFRVPGRTSCVSDQVVSDRLSSLPRCGLHQRDVESGALIRRRVVCPVLTPDRVLVIRIEQLEVVDALAEKVGMIRRPITKVDHRRNRSAANLLQDLSLGRHEVANGSRAEQLCEVVQRRELIAFGFNDRPHVVPARDQQRFRRERLRLQPRAEPVTIRLILRHERGGLAGRLVHQHAGGDAVQRSPRLYEKLEIIFRTQSNRVEIGACIRVAQHVPHAV